jgi:hypothetical protein
MRTLTSIRIDDDGIRRIPRAQVMSRMMQLLHRLPARPLAARVRFSDVNGPKGGADIRCSILVTVPGEPPFEVERLGTSPRLAFDQSYDRIRRRAAEPHRRWRQSRRHPKKYYAAKRLWT